jgi:predicted transcriptional regulator
VARALDTVEEHLDEQSPQSPPAREPRRARPARPGGEARRRRWARRVGDVMTGTVVTVDRITPYQEIDRLLTEHRISGMPVLKMGREVVGVVSEADLLAAEDETNRQARMTSSLGRRRLLHRLMNTHHVQRLPVVDEDGKLVGIVSRRDLLSVFLRPDADIIRDVWQVLDEITGTDPKDVIVTVHHGVVTLTGTMHPGPSDRHDLIPLAVQLVWDIDGVVDVVNKLAETNAGKPLTVSIHGVP